jgi:hypothetical protein
MVTAPVTTSNANNNLGALHIQFGLSDEILGGIVFPAQAALLTSSSLLLSAQSRYGSNLLLVLG